jgi:hypothetical protein
MVRKLSLICLLMAATATAEEKKVPPPVAPICIDPKLLEAVAQYLATRPYQEVVQLMQAIQAEAQKYQQAPQPKPEPTPKK